MISPGLSLSVQRLYLRNSNASFSTVSSTNWVMRQLSKDKLVTPLLHIPYKGFPKRKLFHLS